MLRTFRRQMNFSPLIALAAFLALACPSAEAQERAETRVKPFFVTGGGIAAKGLPTVPGTPAPQWARGHASELGRYFAQGTFELLAFTGPTTATFSSASPCIFVDARGDQLAFTYGDVTNHAMQPGQVQLFPAGGNKVVARFVAEFNPWLPQCTGRFANVVGGSFTMIAVSEPFVFGTTTPVRYQWAAPARLFSVGISDVSNESSDESLGSRTLWGTFPTCPTFSGHVGNVPHRNQT